VTLPTSDTQSSRFRLRRPQTSIPTPTHSVPTSPLVTLHPTSQSLPMPPTPQTGPSYDVDHDRAIDFASHSWDLATGGLKTLTAKRELPPVLERRPTESLSDASSIPRSYTFLLIILVCVVLMLISTGIVLFVMLQP